MKRLPGWNMVFGVTPIFLFRSQSLILGSGTDSPIFPLRRELCFFVFSWYQLCSQYPESGNNLNIHKQVEKQTVRYPCCEILSSADKNNDQCQVMNGSQKTCKVKSDTKFRYKDPLRSHIMECLKQAWAGKKIIDNLRWSLERVLMPSSFLVMMLFQEQNAAMVEILAIH